MTCLVGFDEDKRYHAHRQFADRRQNVNSARTYFYLNEAQCEKNVDIFLRCIEAVSGNLFVVAVSLISAVVSARVNCVHLVLLRRSDAEYGFRRH